MQTNPRLEPHGRDLRGHLLANRYRLDRALAAGGMAEVWQATDIVLARRVAVKLLRPHLAADPAFVRRFRREALAAARLNHPGIVAIFDSCTENDIEAIVMELVEGKTLRQRLDEGPLDAHVAIGIGAQVADALDAAHAGGIIHRDIKPGNMLLCHGDSTVEGFTDVPRLMVTDFGIAKALLRDDGSVNGPGNNGPTSREQDLSANLTRTGAMLGTAKYLAPEQVRGEAVDARTDIYALGVVLYEALCGRPPFQGEGDLATALARLNTDPLLPRQIRPDIRRDLEAVVLRAMARDPQQRYASAADLRAALLAVDRGQAPASGALVDPTDPAPGDIPNFVKSERSWLVPTGFVVLVAAALVTIGALLGRTDTGRDLVDKALVAVGARADSATNEPVDAVPVALGGLSASAFDPFGDNKTENDRLAPLAVDGNSDASSAWRTECYANPFSKPGVGLVLTLETPATLSRLEVDTQAGGWAAQVYVADEPRAALADWGEPVATQESDAGDDRTTGFDLKNQSGRAILLWITSISGVPVDNCFGEKEKSRRLEVTEARVLGSPITTPGRNAAG